MKFYRYESVQYASLSNDGDYEISKIPNPVLELRTYVLHKETPKGYWIGFGDLHKLCWKKWVSKTSRKRFAYPTQKEALINYIKRTERRISILEYQKLSCNITLGFAKEWGEKLMIPIEGTKIIVFGQEVVITQVVEYKGKYRCYLDHNIVVPTKEYTRDYIDSSEIEKIIEN